MTIQELQQRISEFSALNSEELSHKLDVAEIAVTGLRMKLNHGEVRAADPDDASLSGWRVNSWVKQGILLGFRIGQMREMPTQGWTFFDKHTVPLQHFRLESNV